MNDNILVSFVHGYENLALNLPEVNRPALWHLNQGSSQIFNYPFPRNPNDFFLFQDTIAGPMPANGAPSFKKLPRFGFTGICQSDKNIYAGSWNSVYELDKKTFALKRIVSNRLMNDLHGICVEDNTIISVLTCKDTVVFTDMNGYVIDFFSVLNDLSVVRDSSIEEYDWRFISKQFRGSTGYWHFNHVQKLGNEVWLTARNANAFVVVDLKKKKAHMRLMNLPTPVLLHDGIEYREQYYFTSIDGKIIIAEEGASTNKTNQEYVDNLYLYNRDLVSKVIRLEETALNREPNWCRGIACNDDTIYVTIDGRYDTDLSFGLLALTEEGEIRGQSRLKWNEVGDESEIRYVTGFDVLVL